MAPVGIDTGGSVRVGMDLGAEKPRNTRFSCIITVALTVIVQSMLCITVFLLRKQIGFLFTNDQRVVELIARTIPISVSFQIFDVINAGTNGSIKGIGKQSFGFLATLIAYWFIGFPLGNVPSFHNDLQLIDLWLGLSIGAFLIYVTSTFIIAFFVDWQYESKKAVKRSNIVYSSK
jgi:MATE family multidrug resistance protein